MGIVYSGKDISSIHYNGKDIISMYAGNKRVFPPYEFTPWNTPSSSYLLYGQWCREGIVLSPYADFVDIGLRSDGSVWSIDTSTNKAVQAGTETGFQQAYRTMALKDGKLYKFGTSGVEQIGTKTDYRKFVYPSGLLEADDGLYDGAVKISDLTGWQEISTGYSFTNGYLLGVCNGTLYRVYDSYVSQLSTDYGWSCVSGRVYSGKAGSLNYNLAGMAFRDGVLYRITESDIVTMHSLYSDIPESGITAISHFGCGYGTTDTAIFPTYAYCIYEGGLYAMLYVDDSGIAQSMVRIGTESNWTSFYPCTSITYSGTNETSFVVNSKGQLYQINKLTLTKLG